MGCCCFKKKLQVKVVATIAEGSEFDYLRPKGRIIFKMDGVYDYMNDIVSFGKAKKLNNICITHCICHIITEIDGHNQNFSCHCFKYCACRVMLCILMEPKREKLFLLVNKNNYKYISNDILYNNISIWG